MRYLIASDIHGALPAAEALTTRFHEEGADRLLLLGDLLYHGPRNPLPTALQPCVATAMPRWIRWCWTFPAWAITRWWWTQTLR